MRNVKSPPANRSGGSRIVRKEGLGLHGTPVDLPVYRNATIFVIIRTFDHILFSYKNIHNSISNENIHNSISNDLRVIALANEHEHASASGFSNGGVFTFFAKKNLVLTLVARY